MDARLCIRCRRSGIEVAGLALSLLPLLASITSHYQNLYLSLKSQRRLVKELDHLGLLFRVQKTIFNNECRKLLEENVRHDVASTMLNQGDDHPLWTDATLERQLAECLGESYEVLMELAKMIAGVIRSAESKVEEIIAGFNEESKV